MLHRRLRSGHWTRMAASTFGMAYHFNVTCPFWTRFILNPTVGMELLAGSVAGPNKHGCAASQPGTNNEKNHGRKGCATRDGIDVLDGELSSLSQSVRWMLDRTAVTLHGNCPKPVDTHRQNSQQRRLASVLQPDHGDVHLGRPTNADGVSHTGQACSQTVLLFFRYEFALDKATNAAQGGGKQEGQQA